MRSLLVVRGSDEAAVEAALASDADAVAIDLDIPAGRESARGICARIVKKRLPIRPKLIVRLSPLASGETDRDLEAAVGEGVLGALLPQPNGVASIQQLAAKLSVREAELGLDDGATRVLAAVDNAIEVMRAAEFAGASARLSALLIDAASLAVDRGCGE